MAFVKCLGRVLQEDTMEGSTLRDTLGKSLESHDAAELVDGMCPYKCVGCGDLSAVTVQHF